MKLDPAVDPDMNLDPTLDPDMDPVSELDPQSGSFSRYSDLALDSNMELNPALV